MSKNVSDNSMASYIAAGVEVVGEINANGSFRIEGKIKGNISISGRLVLDAPGIIEGDVRCSSAQLSGKLDGKIIVEELLQLTKTAKVHGEIKTSKLAIEDGAIFTGTCDMDNKPSAQSNNAQK